MSKTTLSPHVALFPSAGMGHLTPFLRLAAMLSSRNCTVTLITAQPTVSVAESDHISTFISSHPQIKHFEFQILPFNPSINLTIQDPFFLQFEAISHSVHLLKPFLSSSSPPISAIFSDFAGASSIASIAADLGIPNYILCTTSAKFLSLLAYLPSLISNPSTSNGDSGDVEIPGLSPLPKSSIPPPLFNPNHFFTIQSLTYAQRLPKAKGILVNTFDWFESETLDSLNNGRVLSNLPPVFPIGPLENCESKKECQFLPWLDKQPAESVVYVSFGSRTAMSKDQVREIGNGLERSGCRFIWVLKTSKVDRDDKEELNELVGDSFVDRMKNKGMVVKGWVNQEEILAHPAIGGFISHCGWNSVMEAARRGMPILAWPLHGDQRVNADVAVKAGLGIWESSWGWGGVKLVKGEEIGKKVEEIMGDEKLRGRAKKVGEEAKKAFGVGHGSSEKVLMGVIEMLKKNMEN